jgi:hypothetical protein
MNNIQVLQIILIEFKNMLSDEGDSLSAVLQITAVPVVPKVAIE